MVGGFDEEPPRSGRRFAYQVFLSFRGEDVRKTFIDHLHHALKQRGITTFHDESGLARGEEIQLKLYRAIETSKLSVVTFSPGYATSCWCLDELVKIMKCRSSQGHIVLPVFYGVEPTDVRWQSGTYHEAFVVHEERLKDDIPRVNKWREALRSVADLAGFSPENHANGYEARFIKHIIAEVVKRVDERQLSITRYMVGRDGLVEEIGSWLQNGSSGIEIGIICGPGGVGKTTIAKVVYNNNLHQFEFSCFLDGISKASKKDKTVILLQEQLIKTVCRTEMQKIYNVHEGKEMIKKAIGGKKILVVFDDVDDAKQLHAIFESLEWFSPGGKILITTRKQNKLNVNGASTTKFHVPALSDNESAELFCHHAFNKSYHPHEYTEICNTFIEYCGGLPLALEVLGSSLAEKTAETWKEELAKLDEYPNEKLHGVLKLSFDSLADRNDKDVFLHIAFFMVGMKKSLALMILKGCRLHGEVGIENLIDKCLVRAEGGTLRMHHLIQQMGYEVVRQEAPDELGQQSRLVGQQDAGEVLLKETGTSKIKGLHLDFPDSNHGILQEEQETFETEAFRKMSNLDLLLLENVRLEGDFKGFPRMIKWILWREFPLESIPSNIKLGHVAVLDMQWSCLVQVWDGIKYMSALRFMDLSYSQQLICTPDLSGAPLLECLFLKCCASLGVVHESIGKLGNLMHLNVEGCESLVKIHSSIGNLKKLTILNLRNCKNLKVFPVPDSIEKLIAEDTSFFMPPNQAEPSVTCSSSTSAFLPIGASIPQFQVASPPSLLSLGLYLPSLKILNLARCGISRDDVLELLSFAPSLKELDLRFNPIRVLNNTRCLDLSDVIMGRCTQLESISQMPASCHVGVWDCSSLKRVSFIHFGRRYGGFLGADGCLELEEVDYGCNSRLILGWIAKLDESHANYLGFPGLPSCTSEEDGPLFGRGLYYGGIYQVRLRGHYLTNWFNHPTWGPELHYTVPSNRTPIRALILGLVLSYPSVTELCDLRITVKNLTRMWEWELFTSHIIFNEGDEATWLSHWCIVEHRELRPGDMLHICIRRFVDYEPIVKWGIEVIYEKQEWVEVEEGTADTAADYLTDETGSGPKRRRTKEENGSATVAGWYKNVFGLPILDLSVYLRKTNHDDGGCDLGYNIYSVLPISVGTYRNGYGNPSVRVQ